MRPVRPSPERVARVASHRIVGRMGAPQSPGSSPSVLTAGSFGGKYEGGQTTKRIVMYVTHVNSQRRMHADGLLEGRIQRKRERETDGQADGETASKGAAQ